MDNKPFEVLPDVDSGGWWISGWSLVKPFPKYILPVKEIADIQCENLNRAYELGVRNGPGTARG